MDTPQDACRIGDDLIWGAEAIGMELNLPARKVYYLAGQGHIPIAKVGVQLVASRRRLREYFVTAA
ncbi:MAG TPA: hypothetical protein VME41_16685 [Stellaceae bacterium]|nr:hypothetical protein [Stellaceae bacterium]